MRIFRALPPALIALLALSGCGYVHFGRLPGSITTDGSLEAAYAGLGTQNKMLQQELALARKEGDALRAALDGRADGAASVQLTQRLSETARELAALRASYAKLIAAKSPEASAPAADPEIAAKLSATEEKLAASLRNFTQLQEENARLRTDLDRTAAENTTLTAQVKTITAQNEQAQSALAQLNTELLAQKDARDRAEQQTAAARAQLSAVIAARDSGPATLTSARESSALSTATLKLADAPPTDKPATAELRTSSDRLRAKAEQAPAASAAPASAPSIASTPAISAPAPRIHVVAAGDTLERIAKKYYGDPGKWNLIYFANNAQLSGGRPLKPGMELEIPEK
jgi:nucleoid-associated protein YgaU